MKNLEKVLLGIIIGIGFTMLVLAMTSCTVSRGLGCYGPQQGWVGCGGNR
jgi:hypothetical protein